MTKRRIPPHPNVDHDPESKKAAAELHRLAQAAALLRLYEEHEGEPVESPAVLAAWVPRARSRGLIARGQIKPSSEDYAAIERSHPDLARVAGRSNPYLSGSN
jgi:hypothetical protein